MKNDTGSLWTNESHGGRLQTLSTRPLQHQHEFLLALCSESFPYTPSSSLTRPGLYHSRLPLLKSE